MENSYSLISLLLLFLGLAIFEHPKKTLNKAIFSCLSFAAFVLIVAYCASYYFTGTGLNDAVLYHLKYGLQGAGFWEYEGIILGICFTIFTGLLLFVFLWKEKTQPFVDIGLNEFGIVCMFGSLVFNPIVHSLYDYLDPYHPIADDSFEEYYRKPQIIRDPTKQAKNLVYIYAESLEQTYFDESVFPGLMVGLKELQQQSIHFSNIKQVHGTDWTIAGMTASQCGIPLVTPSHGNSMSGMDEFLSSAICMGDLLSEEGYQLNYLGGAHLDFAGKGKFYNSHGFSNVRGKQELLPLLSESNYQNAWGLYDDSLLAIAYDEFLRLSQSKEKFGLFMLTLDTHHPDGHPSKSCKGIRYKDGSNPILNAVACSDYLLSSFIRKLKNSPYAKNTVIVLVSDHLAMRNTAFDSLKRHKERKNLFMVFDPTEGEVYQEISTIGSPLDIAPTLLHFIGYSGDIGLGRDLLNKLEADEERQLIVASLREWDDDISQFWNFPKLENGLHINVSKRVITIDKRDFRLPVFVEIDQNFNTKLKFPYAKLYGYRELIKAKGTYFMLLDRCRNIPPSNISNHIDLCMLAGNANEDRSLLKLNGGKVFYNNDDIKKLVGYK